MSALPCHAQYAASVQADDPFAYWRLDEPPGATTLINNGTEVVPDAAYAGDVTLNVPGLADTNNPAVQFGGTDGTVQIPNSNQMNSGGPWEEKTIELWFSAADADTAEEQVLYEQGGTTRGLNIYIRDSQLFVGGWNAASDDGGATSPWPGGTDLSDPASALFLSTPIESNTPYHVALVMDGDSEADSFLGTFTGYLNGEPFGEAEGVGRLFAHTNASSIGATSSQTFFDTGNNNSAATNNFAGVIDDVALYNTALSAERIKAHFDSVTYLAGDFNDDGVVDLGDFMILAQNIREPGTYAEGDMDFDRFIDLDDFVQWRRAFHSQAVGGATQAAVPEPAAGWLLGLSAWLVLQYRGRGRRNVLRCHDPRAFQLLCHTDPVETIAQTRGGPDHQD